MRVDNPRGIPMTKLSISMKDVIEKLENAFGDNMITVTVEV